MDIRGDVRKDIRADVRDDVPRTILALETAVEALQEQLRFANNSLTAERERVDELLAQLADARTAAMISGADAAALRAQLELLTGKRVGPCFGRRLFDLVIISSAGSHRAR